MSSQQLHTLYLMMLLGSVAGLAVSALTIDPKHLFKHMIIALAIMAVGAGMDSFSNNLTRPANMYLSQFLLAFGGMFFLGPTVVMGFGGVIADPRNMVSFATMFGITQSVGALIGSAAMGTLQTVREKFHSSNIVDHLTLVDAQVQSRLNGFTGSYASAIVDPSLRANQGIRALATAATREANVLAYNDVFMTIAIIAVLTMFWIFGRSIWLKCTAQPVAASAPPQPPTASSSVQSSGANPS